ncbi:MAG: AbrB/MazE/SpoVT family DNA-binding domain-containing protein [Euryarchaeota archaeon]|nr:AbrB/MazE/SpoVT family DNA-binding domain-containing protein [Euryarchaeota archaeon]
MISKSAKISSKGQVTLPREIREKYHLKEGEEAMILQTDEGILIKHKRVALRGMLSEKIDIKGFEKELEKLRKEWTI